MTTTQTTITNGIATVTLARPEVHNAFDPPMIAELTEAFQQLGSAGDVRVVVLAAQGKSFCAGADLHWMRSMVDFTHEENVADALALAGMLRAIYECPKPVIARVQGAAYGGGVGLLAACDLAVAVESAALCFSEAKLGLIPAVISPFVLRKVPPGIARRYFLTAEKITAAEAHRTGLVSQVVTSEEALDAAVERWTDHLRENGPEAMAACKRLVDEVAPPDWDNLLPRVAAQIAARRASAEGQEGMRAFLEKRSPAWRAESEGGGVP